MTSKDWYWKIKEGREELSTLQEEKKAISYYSVSNKK